MSRPTSFTRVTLPATSRAPAMARRAIRQSLPNEDSRGDRRSDATILVNELVTNAVRHGDLPLEEPISVAVELLADRIHVEVSDRGRGFMPIPMPRSDGERTSGWGLLLVDRLADSWGVAREDAATTVWFDIRR